MEFAPKLRYFPTECEKDIGVDKITIQSAVVFSSVVDMDQFTVICVLLRPVDQ